MDFSDGMGAPARGNHTGLIGFPRSRKKRRRIVKDRRNHSQVLHFRNIWLLPANSKYDCDRALSNLDRY
jgi:hypothetical protein